MRLLGKKKKEEEDEEFGGSTFMDEDCFEEDPRRNPCLDSLVDYLDWEERKKYEF